MASTILKPKKPVQDVLSECNIDQMNNKLPTIDNMTVEQYLEQQFEDMVKDFKKHAEQLVKDLRNQYQEGATSIKTLMLNNISNDKPVCVTLRVIAGPHIGQRFRLEASTENGEDVFKMGRSTGRLFKEKGVSLYKDKEISTTHARIEIRNHQVFLVDAKSTNGTLLNNEDVEAQAPYRLKDNDIITMGSTEIHVHVSDVDFPDENKEQTEY